MTSDAFLSCQPSIIQAIEATMNVVKPATVTARVQVRCHGGSGQDRVAAANILRIVSSSVTAAWFLRLV